MKKLYIASLTVFYFLIVGCAPVPPIPNGPWAGQTTENRKNISIMNSETVANGMDSARGGNRYDCVPVTADVSKTTRATVDTQPDAGWQVGRRRNSGWNNGWNNQSRPINRFEDYSESNVVMVCK